LSRSLATSANAAVDRNEMSMMAMSFFICVSFGSARSHRNAAATCGLLPSQSRVRNPGSV
jgi:hypothetical protein